MIKSTPGYHTHGEILSQPQVWQQTLEGLQERGPRGLPDLSAYSQVLFTGCGSTHYLAQWAARMCEQVHGVVARAVPASELWLFPSAWLRPERSSLMVAISRSGETSETVRAVEAFGAGGHSDTLAITCYPDSPLARACRWVVATPAGQEQSIAQTRSFTSMMLAVAWLLASDEAPQPPSRLVSPSRRLLQEDGETAARLGRDHSFDRFYCLGSGPLIGLAREGMLKMKEMSLSHAEAFHFLEFRHGPMSMVGPGSLVIGLMSDGAQPQELVLLAEMRALGAFTLALAQSPDTELRRVCDETVVIDCKLPAVWRAPLYLPVLQLLAYHRALARELDPDQPTHLHSVVRLTG
jgi:glucosamine--fructose-6-phosphate aminotransferase (isomerizing)